MTRYNFVRFDVTPTAGGATVSYPNGASLIVGEDLTIVAIYATMTHIITFNSYPISVTYDSPSGAGGGSTLEIEDGSSITIQAPPTVDV